MADISKEQAELILELVRYLSVSGLGERIDMTKLSDEQRQVIWEAAEHVAWTSIGVIDQFIPKGNVDTSMLDELKKLKEEADIPTCLEYLFKNSSGELINKSFTTAETSDA